MVLFDPYTVLLPDGTPLTAYPSIEGDRTRYDDAAGLPRYLADRAGRLSALVYDAAIDGYAVVPCDLTIADLQRIP
jgi:hypothetical protein